MMNANQIAARLCLGLWGCGLGIFWGISSWAAAPESQLRSLPQPSVRDRLVQRESTTVNVIGARLDRTVTGLEVILDIEGGSTIQVNVGKFRTEGNSSIIDITNAVLSLPTGQSLVIENPTADIAKLQVVQQDRSIRVSVTGKTALPQTAVTLKVNNVEYSLNPQLAESEIEINVIGENARRAYRTPKASSATRTDTPILTTPAAIQVVPQQVIRDRQVIGIDEALKNVSAVIYKGGIDGRGFNFGVRGFENAPVLRDGFRIYGNFQGIAETANLDRVEVLKGPASILYGDVQPGGVINLVSKLPSSTPLKRAEVQLGSRNLTRSQLDLTGPLTADSKILYRVNASYQTGNSWRDYTTPLNRWSLSPSLTFKLSDRTDLTTFVEYINENKFADFGQIIIGNTLANVPRTRTPNNPDDAITNKYLRVGYNLEHRFSDNWKINNTFSYQDSSSDYSVLGFPLALNPITNVLNRSFADQDAFNKVYALQTNTVGKFTTGTAQHTLLAGVDLASNENRLITKNTFPSSPLIPFNIFAPIYSLKPSTPIPLSSDNTLSGKRLGVYVQDQVSLLDDRLIVLGGLRYDTVDRNNNAITPTTTTKVSRQDSAVTPRVGALYRLTPDLSVYGSYSQSFNPTSAVNVSGSPLPPETAAGFETGLKAEFLDRKLAATISYFDLKRRNIAVANPEFFGFSLVAEEQSSQGIELDINGQISPGWNVSAAYAYTDAKFTKDAVAANIGSRLSNIPYHSGSIWTTYEIQQGNLKGLGFGVGLNYVGERFGGLPTSYRADPYLLTDAAVFYKTGDWRFGLNVKNLFNVDYIQSLSQSSRNRLNYSGEPITIVGSVAVEF